MHQLCKMPTLWHLGRWEIHGVWDGPRWDGPRVLDGMGQRISDGVIIYAYQRFPKMKDTPKSSVSDRFPINIMSHPAIGDPLWKPPSHHLYGWTGVTRLGHFRMMAEACVCKDVPPGMKRERERKKKQLHSSMLK